MSDFILIVIGCVIAALCLFSKLINCTFNIIALIRKDTEHHSGMIFNHKTKKLEPDNSKTILF